MDEHPDDILGIDEAAAITPWSASSLYRIAQEGGDSPFRKRRGRWATTRADLAAWVRSGHLPNKQETAESPMPKSRRGRRRRGSVLSEVHRLRKEQHQ
jgi:hypothetical protein